MTIGLDPRNCEAHHIRGKAWHAKGDFDKALSDFDEAIRLDPKSPGALDSRAWLRATCPKEKYRDGAKAIEDATKACERMKWKYPYSLDILAAAYAEAGQFDKAVEWQKKAIERLAAAYAQAGQFYKAVEWQQKAIELEARKKEFQDRLKLYQEGKPYRDEPKK